MDADDDDDDRPTRRPPPVAELAKAVEPTRLPLESDDDEPTRHGSSDARTQPLSVAPEPYTDEPEPISVEPEPIAGRTGRGSDPAGDDDELPTLPPTRPDALDDGLDDDPTIVEPFAYFARDAREAFEARDALDDRTSDRPLDDRPTDRSIRAADPVGSERRPSPPRIPVAAETPPSPPAMPAHRASAPRRPPEPPPAPRVLTTRAAVASPVVQPAPAPPAAPAMSAPAAPHLAVPPVAGPGSISAMAMSNQQGLGAPMVSRAVPSAPPAAPVLSSQMFRASQRPASKATNVAAGVAALVVIAAAGYLGAMSGRPPATPETVSSEASAAAKVEPPPPSATVEPRRDPQPPSPTAEAPPAPRAREASGETSARRTTADEESPRGRRTASDEDSTRTRRTTSDEDTSHTRASGEAPRSGRTRTPRPPADEESGTAAPPETRLPEPSDAPARPTIDQGALRAAFAEGEAKARACLGATSPSGTARFSVTFAPTGEAVGAVISGAPFANTLEGQCMVGKFRSLHVPPFTGGEVIVRKSITF